MRVTVEWLKDFVATDASAEEIGDTLTMLGLELEEIESSDLGPVLNFKVTPNRGDCLSVLGLARELAAKDIQKFRPTSLMTSAISGFMRGDENQSLADWRISIDNPNLCSRYAARAFSNIVIKPSSHKLQKRLIACGMRPINAIVDVSNAVMLELGQPLHAFDADTISDNHIVVRTARAKEKLTTLDDVSRDLSTNMLMICDEAKPMAVAGVMGGLATEVTDATTNIILESAHFEPAQIRATRKSLGMNTEASYRFERFVDPEGIVRALNRFADMLYSEIDADCIPGLCDVFANKTHPNRIMVREKRWNTLLGMGIPKAGASAILNSLGFQVSENKDGLDVTPPSWRSDIHREDDLVEEIGRVWGYENIPEVSPAGTTPLGGIAPLPAFLKKAREAMLRCGFVEVLNHTLGSVSELSGNSTPVELRNPGSPDMSLLRTSILPGLAKTIRKNKGRHLCAFEIGSVFQVDNEFPMLGIIMQGPMLGSHWEGGNAPKSDFYAIKGIVETLSKTLHRRISFSDTNDNRLHSTRRARIMCSESEIGMLGQVDPAVAEKEDLPKDTVLAEINLVSLFNAPETVPVYSTLSPFPSLRRDLAMVVSTSVSYAEIESEIRNSAGPLLEDVWLFDRYQGKGVETGKHSLAIALVLRKSDGTLTDDEANGVLSDAWTRLQKLGATQRA